VNHADHAHVPVGTIADHEGYPVTILRDYSHGLIPEMELTVAGVDQLVAILPDLRAQMVAAEAEERAEAAEEEGEESSAAGTIATLACGCQVTGGPDEEPFFLGEEIYCRVLGEQQRVKGISDTDDDDPCARHGGKGEGRMSCRACLADAGFEDAAPGTPEDNDDDSGRDRARFGRPVL